MSLIKSNGLEYGLTYFLIPFVFSIVIFFVDLITSLKKEFSKSFSKADLVIMCPVYAAGEKKNYNFNKSDLYHFF